MSTRVARENDVYQEWLGAYADGELTADRRAWVEAHLAECSDCQRELADLRALAILLHADPAPRPALSAGAFAGQVTRRLPGRARSWGGRLLRYTPLALFGAWAFFQVVIVISGGLLWALSLNPSAKGLMAAVLPAAGAGNLAPAWLMDAVSLLIPTGLPGGWIALDWTDALILFNIALIALLTVLFLAWLAAYWSHRRARASVS